MLDKSYSSNAEILEIEILAAEIRIKTIEMIGRVGKGHIGGSMSIADAIAVLYGGAMRIDPNNPNWDMRDRLVFSKGHSGPALYAALTLKGFFPQEWLYSMNQLGSRLPSHVHARLTPGVDASTGSLGQGLSVAVGMALADQMDNRDSFVYCILGDGECQEGQVWEAAMFAGNHKLNRLIAMVDYNKRQCSGRVDRINDLKDIGEKFRDFGFSVMEVDGHDLGQIYQAVDIARHQSFQPVVIILNTIKGMGCQYAEKAENCHNVAMVDEQTSAAVKVLEKKLDELKERRGLIQ